ncbi:MAG: calcium-translocating P-type ATPase, SERCA-type [Candidatus Aenigmarchaeota archaeon]|nr:calcium-translocating P-type ATPase, SERCA-type [Candidatus Aenigmarchaeota archaeon]
MKADGVQPKWHELEEGRVVKELKSREEGLAEKEAEARLDVYGRNELKQEKKISRLEIFISQFRNILVIILIAAAVISYVWVPDGTVDAILIFIIVILNAIFGYIQEYRAEKAIEALKKLAVPQADVIREGRRQEVDSRELVPGDIILIEEGTRIPADIRLLEVINLRVDEASLTGESSPVAKQASRIRDCQLAERKNMAYTGTLATYGRAKGIVIATGMSTEIGRIARLIEEVEEEATPLQERLEAFGKNLGYFILAIAAVVVIIGLAREGFFSGQLLENREVVSIIIMGIALAVAAIPEGLPAIVTITLALGLQRLSKRNAIIRKLPAVETLGSTTVICSDKTGTLTKNEMTVTKIWYYDRYTEVTGRGYETAGDFRQKGLQVDPKKDNMLLTLLKASILCNNASLRPKDQIAGDPTEAALIVAAAKAGLEQNRISSVYRRLHEIPFSSERKMMTTINSTPEGRPTAFVKGAPEIVLSRCDRMLINGKVIRLAAPEKKTILKANHEMTEKALRVLGIAYKEFSRVPEHEQEAENNMIFVGLTGMIDPPRAEVKDDIGICRKAGIKVVMITGDHRNTAVAIAKELGLFEKDDRRAVTGEELDSMTDEQLYPIVKNIAVYARVNPEHKMRIVDALRKRGHIVAMTGDGVNDAPALKKADIGVAMGIKGTDVSKEASDMILADDNFTSIVSAVEEGRGIFDNIRKFIQYLLSSNLGEVLIVFLAILIGFADPATGAFIIPLSAIQLLWINLLTDGLPALALGVDPAAKDIMKRKPLKHHAAIFDKEMLVDMLIVGILMAIGVLGLFWYNLSHEDPSIAAKKAMTVAFTAVVMMEMFRVQSVRMKYGLGIFSNSKLLLAIGLSILLQLIVVYIPALQIPFKTMALDGLDWTEIIAASAAIMAVMWGKEKIRKGMK